MKFAKFALTVMAITSFTLAIAFIMWGITGKLFTADQLIHCWLAGLWIDLGLFFNRRYSEIK